MNRINYKSWLETLTPGNEVAIRHKNFLSHYKSFYTIETIVSISDSIIHTDAFPYQFESGLVIQDVWDSQTHVLTPVTQEIMDSVEKRALECFIDSVDKSELTLGQLKAIKKIVVQSTKKDLCMMFDGCNLDCENCAYDYEKESL